MNNQKRTVYFFPKYSDAGPSSRYRIYSYLPFYSNAGLKYKISPLLGKWYLKNKWQHKSMLSVMPRIIFSYLRRLSYLLKIRKDSLVYIGADSLPGLPPIFEQILVLRKIPYIIEFDDAVFHSYDDKRFLKNKYKFVIKNASYIITGSSYLTDYVKKWNSKVTEIPTSINANTYKHIEKTRVDKNELPIIGWIGSPTSSRYILSIIPILKLLRQEKDFELHLIGFDKSLECHLNGLRYKIISWSADTEVENIAKFTVGIMPLKDSPFERGKCAFKLVQYMAVGIPTISTPLQSNIDISLDSNNLFASSPEEWLTQLKNLLNNLDKYQEVGKKNKEIALANYTFQNNWGKYLNIIDNL